MNKPIRSVAIFCMVLFLALMLNVTYLQFVKANDYNHHPGNTRSAEQAYSRERGLILAGKKAIARSKPSGDRFKYLRVYPKPYVYAPVTGYLQLGAQTGVEHSENDILSGEDSRLFVNRLVDMLQGETNQGGNVITTIDPAAQLAGYNALKRVLGPHGEGAAVAIQPKTGKILAMVSLPSYDPNKLASHDYNVRTKYYDRLNRNKQQPLLNRATYLRLFPGSTFKVVTAAAAIENGLYNVGDEVPTGSGYQLPGTTGSGNVVHNETGSYCDPSQVSFATAMEWSCNTAFAQMAVKLGPEQLRKQAEAFGFNSDYLQDYSPVSQSVFPQSVTDPGAKQSRELNLAETARSGFGQFEVQATPLQMAMVSAAIGNHGKLMRPYLIDQLQTADYRTLETTQPDELRQAVSAKTAAEVTQLMNDTVRSGTASPASIPGVQVAGKTGTAQSGVPGRPPYAWFTSFAPSNDPEVAVAVMIQSAPGTNRAEIAGGTLGGPVAKAMMEAVMNK
ncbi:MAG: penicillin-binding protein 2 [Nocardioidaceae bacterium]|nr:penicillin-binding protein 2 [Nocardioidaceae bacterium]MCL2614279.1 penicillin-binding protein 2 [Nocardioidaceae bacterium]